MSRTASEKSSDGGFIVSADWHCHAWADAGAPIAGINGRLVDFITALRELITYARQHKIERVYMLGDVWHLKKNIPEQARNQLFMCLYDAVRTGIQFEFLAGNHDREDDRPDSVTILPFQAFAKVWTEPYADLTSRIVYVPWKYNQESMRAFLHALPKRDWALLLFHGELDGAEVGPTDYQLKSKMTAKALGLERFHAVFAGHLHKRQHVKGVWYPGSLIAKDFGELELDKGFLHVHPDGTVTPVVVTYPAFAVYIVRADWKKDQTWEKVIDDIAGKLVRILTPEPLDPALVKRLEQANPRYLDIRLLRDRAVLVPPPKQGDQQTFTTLIKSYVEQRGVPAELSQVYEAYGLQIMERET